MASNTSKEVGDADSQLADDIKELVETVPPFSTESCIFKVPHFLRSLNPACYTPKLISLGPLHHGAENLQIMEVYKIRYLHALLHQFPEIDLQDLVKCLRGLEERAINSYEDHFTFRFESNEFVKLMLLDGCFIIMFLMFFYTREGGNVDDPLFFTRSLADFIYSDMMLLENQLPFFVVEQLYICINSFAGWRRSFFELIGHVFQAQLQIDQMDQLKRSGHQVKHFVDYILNCNLPARYNHAPPSQATKIMQLPSATELQQSGIKFSKGTSNCFLDIKFTNGVIEIPTLTLKDDTEQIFRNLIAMEQYNEDGTCYMTNYMVLMDDLISSPGDIALLRSRGIFNNFLGSDEDAAEIFNGMVQSVINDITVSHYNPLLEEVNAHYNKRWNFFKARLRKDYFNTPWAVISFAAAFFLLICTVIQTVSIFM